MSKPAILIMTAFNFLVAVILLYFWWWPEGLPDNNLGAAEGSTLFAFGIAFLMFGVVGLMFFFFEESVPTKGDE